MLALEPRYAKAMINLAAAESRRGNSAEATHGSAARSSSSRTRCRRTRASRTCSPTRAISTGRAGQPDAAAIAYRQAIELKPDFALAMENLGNTDSLRGDHAAALQWFERARSAGARSPSLFMNIANELVRLNRMTEARAAYEQALGMGPPSDGLRANYAGFLARHNRATAP